MPRPYLYRKLDSVFKSGDHMETHALGFDTMWGVKKGDDWITLCREDVYQVDNKPAYRKYARLFFATQQSAQTQADKMNKMFKSTEYRVESI
tara:strand:+ start:264 stop:539 length:276 start_codon:yes stop_codon:yes gene_type:complete